MGQFKPMVKMETTEPSVVLKLKKGGHVNMKKGGNGHSPMKKMDGGPMGDMGAMNTPPMIRPPVVGGPSIGSPRRPSMAERRKMMAMAAMMKNRPAAAAPMGGLPTMKKGGMATGGVALGNAGGYKKGGMPMKGGKPAFLKKMMGGGMMEGYETGGVVNGQGGYKKGGAAKKFADGGRVDSGRAVSMPQGHKKPTPPVATNLLAGTFKKGGGVKKFNGGGDAQSYKETKGHEGTYTNQKAENLADREVMNPMPFIRPLVKKIRSFFGSSDAPGAVTKTKESTTVVPAKQRSGGMANC